ncbi:hypothetical protein BGZ96_004814 [Linnemannia gamsii]|uniref:BMERB domain-containing protein n=1 Tax=Linnemannia gamsii TaxID=64522 RepID=A0ABQ7K6G7_9FUNG|nr:hypothetical protein BGZ96_004814 [Linnemannia gamsii]
MWDPAFNDPSAQQQQQQQQQRSPDLTTRPTTTATAAADRDRPTLHTFGAKLPEINSVERVDPTTDLLLARYNDSDDHPSYQNGYPLPLNQVPIGGPTSDRVMLSSEDIMPPPPPLLPPSSSKEAFMIGSTVPQETSAINTVAPNLHQHQERHIRSYIDNTNNIPVEIDTFSRVSSTLNPDQTDDNSQLPVLAESTSLSSPPPQMSTPEERYPQDRCSTSSSPAPTLAPASPTSPTRIARDTSPCIARLSIPASHISLFQDALKSPPDPDLKVRKKTVRFNKTDSPPRFEHRHERREAESYAPYSSSSKSPSTPSTPSPLSYVPSSKSSFGSSKSTSTQPQIVDKDPEERMAELMELKQMKIRQEDLLHLKEQVFQTGQNLEEKQTILDEVRAERKVLHTELNRYIAMVKQVQKDLELATQAETQLTKERDQLSQYLAQLRDHDFNVLKEEVDQLRSKKGLRPLPSLEQEQEEFMGRYLEERRGQWREDGAAWSWLLVVSIHHSNRSSNQLEIVSHTQ